MNTRRVFLLIFLLYQTLVSPLWAATYYVDNTPANASDTNAGTATQPWVHCPGMLGWTGSAKLVAGDVVYFKNTASWSNGSSSAFLTLVGGVTYDGAAWGTGTRATFRQLVHDTAANRNALISFTTDHPTLATIARGFHLDGNNKQFSGVNINRPTALRSLVGAAKVVQNCIVHDLGDPGGTVFGLYGIVVGSGKSYNTENVEIVNNLVFNTARAGITVYDALAAGTHHISNVLIRNNEVHHAGTGADIRGDGVQVKDSAKNVIVEHNYTHHNDGRGIYVEDGEGRPGPQNVHLRYNIVSNNDLDGITICQPASKSVDIYGNLIFRNGIPGSGNGSGILFQSDLSELLDIKIYNNTLFENQGGEIVARSAAQFSTFEVKNNILASLSNKTPLLNQSSSKITAHSNNIYYRPGGGTLVTEGSSYQASNLSSFESTAFSSSPLLKSSASLPSGFIDSGNGTLAPNADGLSLTADSQAIDNGVALDAAYGGSVGSVLRPAGARWDIGAYEYGSVDSTPTPTPTPTPTESTGWISSAIWQNQSFAEQGGVFMATFDAIPRGNSIDGVTAFSGVPMQSYSDGAALIVFSQSGTIAVRNGGAYAADVAVPYTAGQSYHMRVKIDIAHHVYSVWVTPPGGTELQIAAGYAFRTEQANVSVLNNIGILASTEASAGTHQVSNIVVTAIPSVYTIMVSAGAGGIVSPGGPVTLNSGASQSFTISPYSGYNISDVKVDGVSVGAVSTYMFSNVTANRSIAASFAAIRRGKGSRK